MTRLCAIFCRRPRAVRALAALTAAGAIGMSVLLTSPAVSAQPEGPTRLQVDLEATTSFWWTIHEEVENGLRQAGSLDPADETASGFNFHQGRLGMRLAMPGTRVAGLLRIRLEERTDVIDFWGSYLAADWLTIAIGQMKIPAPAEVLQPDHELDFISRTSFARNVGDYALARTPYISSVMAAKGYNRDLGLALRGHLPGGCGACGGVRYFLMVGNGLGGNRYVGGSESDEFLYTNAFGDFYYGARLEGSPVRGVVLGIHGSLNRHEDVALAARGPVFDFDRRVWTADACAELPHGLRVGGFYGDGQMEDYSSSQSYRFDYAGWGGWVLWEPRKGRLQFGLRHDAFRSEFQQDGNDTLQRNWTLGINYRPAEALRLQLNYVAKETVNDYEPDLADNIIYLNAQFSFDGPLIRTP